MKRLELDWGKLLCSTRRKEIHDGPESMGTGIGREELERDYDRILFAAPTRRLADKTQVFPLEPNDSVRTRLTHSHEVSNLARSIGVRLAFDHRVEVFGSTTAVNVQRVVPALLAAIGLAHDLGNPPFGHQGEISIRRWFTKTEICDPDFTGFDGNCQTFRLLTKLQVLNDEYGLNLTCATLAGLMKYPVFSKEKRSFNKFGLFESERNTAEDVWSQTGLAEGVRHPLVYVMEACDDIAYSVIDAEDTIKKGFASFNDLLDAVSDGKDEVTEKVINSAREKNSEFKKEGLSSAELNDLSMQMFRVKAIAEMVVAATDAFVASIGQIMSGDSMPNFELIANSPAASFCQRLKKFDRRFGFAHPDVLRLELEGHNFIHELMDMLWRGINHGESSTNDPFAKYVFGRMSENYRRAFEGSRKWDADKAHLLCDVVSGMTEAHLISLTKELRSLK